MLCRSSVGQEFGNLVNLRLTGVDRSAPWKGGKRVAPGKRSAARSLSNQWSEPWEGRQTFLSPLAGALELPACRTPGCASLARSYGLLPLRGEPVQCPLRGAPLCRPLCGWYMTPYATRDPSPAAHGTEHFSDRFLDPHERGSRNDIVADVEFLDHGNVRDESHVSIGQAVPGENLQSLL